jgi:hypothetical protein
VPRPDQVCVIDTSSLLVVRERFGRNNEQTVFSSLTALVTTGNLFFPPEVYGELERGCGTEPDPPLRWARSIREQAERRARFETVQAVLAVAPDVLDPDSPYEPADPYVVALGLDMRVEVSGIEVTIITDDRRDKPGKLSLATAAGLVRLPTVPLFAFLRAEGMTP